MSAVIFAAFLLNTAQANEGVQAGASVSGTARIGISECADAVGECPWINFNDTAVFSPWATANPNPNVSARAHFDVRLHGPAGAYGLDNTQDADALQPWSLRIRDAWVSARSDHTELRIGAQRIAWGVANGVSVVDTVNPLNLEDPSKFDQRLSTLSMAATAHSTSWSITGVIIPFFVPAALPQANVDLMAGADDLFDQRFTGSENIQVGALSSRPKVPEDTLQNTSVATQIRWTPSLGDFALSWHHGKDSLPQVSGDVILVGYQTKNDEVDVGVPLIYPNLDIVGFTGRGELFADITGWVETAVVFPEQTQASPSAAQLDALVKLGTISSVPDPIPTSVTQDGDVYTKWVAGVERPFGSTRITAQWLHGFFTERQADDLNDYGMLGLRWTVNPTIRVDANIASDFTGGLGDFALTYLHADTAEISIGGTYIQGPSTSAFGGLQGASNLRTSMTMAF
ncbi:MAG: hypothetical protein CL930_02410 [Deltaproteobacteria bacterium]|nr:hypothetical protein [Deltaproteobacteria bacterium]